MNSTGERLVVALVSAVVVAAAVLVFGLGFIHYLAADLHSISVGLETLTNRRAIFDVSKDGCVVHQFDTLEVP